MKRLNSIKKYFTNPASILLFVAIIFYWQISSLGFCLKWDMIDAVLPFRYFIGECLQNGHLPLWNPYQFTGIPIYADMQYPLWYPETLLIGSIFGYSNYTLHFLFTFYIFIAGFGVFKLTSFLNVSKNIALLSGIVYMTSGFFVGHAQAMFAIISATWIPYILLFYLKMNKSHNILDALKSAFFMFLLISNGYQTFTIIFGYFLLLIFLFEIISHFLSKDYKNIRLLIKTNFIFFLSTAILSTVIIVSLIQVAPFASRLRNIPPEVALVCPLSPQSLISLLIPFSAIKNPSFFNTDISMTNIFFGIIFLIFFIYSLFQKKKGIFILFALWGVFCLFVAFGEYTPLRMFLYKHIPMMNLFRSPSYFSLFTILTFIILAAKSMSDFFKHKNSNRQIIIGITLGFWITLAFLFVFSATKISIKELSFLNTHLGFKEMMQSSTLSEHIFIHSFIQFILISIFMFSLLKNKNLVKTIMIIVIIEMFISVQLNIHYTGVSVKSPQKLHNKIKNLPKGFPIPQSKKVIENSDISGAFLPVWRNTNTFHKKISYEGFSSFVLDPFLYLSDSFPKLKNAVLNNYPLYLSSQIFSNKTIKQQQDYSQSDLFINENIYKKLSKDKLRHTPTDTVFITSFLPTKIEAIVISKSPQVLTLLQSNYPGWSVLIDGKETKHFTSNHVYISTKIPAGESKIVFIYQNRMVKFAFFVSYSALFLMLILFLLNNTYFKSILSNFAPRKKN
ncbi:MAG: hypothetical protein U9R42_11520 [Bacteroidota bacterium]|nr:hypothetical protein [Bacteroidota bacterium]